MADQIIIQVRFKKLLWICPKCQQEDVVDASVTGGNTYEHNCSKCDTWFNTFKTYEGIYSIPKDEYDKIDSQALEDAKTAQFNTWLDTIHNPPVYVAPTQEEFENMYREKLAQAQDYLEKIADMATEAEVLSLQAEATSKIDSVEIVNKTPIEDVDK